MFNRTVKGDEDGEYTFTRGRGNCTITDFVLKDREVKDNVKRLRMGDGVDSNNQVVEV